MFVTENISLLNNNNNKKIIIIRVGVGALWLVEAAFNQHFGFCRKTKVLFALQHQSMNRIL